MNLTQLSRSLAIVGCAGAVFAGTLLIGSNQCQAVSFSLDDNPSLGGGFGLGAEDEFGLTAALPLAPSPSLGALGSGSDGALVSPAIGGLEQVPNGMFIDAFSTNHFRRAFTDVPIIQIEFSVDRITPGLPGSASAAEFAVGQQPGDIYTSTATFPNPAVFVGALGAGPFAGPLPSAGVGGSNTLAIDESAFGLLTAAGIVGPGTPAGPITPGSHDNVDAFDHLAQIPGSPAAPLGVYPVHSYFAVAPDEAVAVGVSAADIFDTAAFSLGTASIPFAPAASMGLDTGGTNTDSIDALVVFDGGRLGGPVNNGPGAEPGIDYALFSLAPGSASLAPGALVPPGLSASDVFFTDFSGAFGVYAFPGDLGLLPGAPGFPFQNQSNIDALEIRVPEPTALGLMFVACIGILVRRGRSS